MFSKEPRFLIAFLGLLFSQVIAVGQPTPWPDGIYFEQVQFLNRTPDLTSPVDLTENSLNNLIKYGCSQYVFKSKGDGISNYRLNMKPRIIVHNGEVYVNTLKMELGEGYAKCLTKGHFLVFPANTSNTDAISAGGAAMLLLTGVGPGRTVRLEFSLFVLSLRTGNHRPFTKEYVKERLNEHNELLEAFIVEPNVNDSVLIHYMDALNRSLESSME